MSELSQKRVRTSLKAIAQFKRPCIFSSSLSDRCYHVKFLVGSAVGAAAWAASGRVCATAAYGASVHICSKAACAAWTSLFYGAYAASVCIWTF
jgi:hypothetical protein